jgi:hypothetical protein
MEGEYSLLNPLTKKTIANSLSELSEMLNDPKKNVLSGCELFNEQYFVTYQEKDESQSDSSLQAYVRRIIDSRAELCAMLNDPKIDVIKIDELGMEKLIITYCEKPQPHSSNSYREQNSTGSEDEEQIAAISTQERE